jgi:hypothetical protein
VQLRPNPTFLANLGFAFRRAGDWRPSVPIVVLRMNSRQAATLGKLGRALIQQPAEAEAVLLAAAWSH